VMWKLAPLIALAFAAVLLASACGGGEAQPAVTPTATPAFTATATTAPTGAPTAGDGGARPIAGTFSTVLDAELAFPELEFLVAVKPAGAVIDQVAVFCERGISFNPQGPKDVGVEDGRFQVEFAGVVIEGRFVSPTRAEGTIRALTGEGQEWLEELQCGVPEQGQWTAEHAAEPSFGMW
jgi:hypothetical protein